MKNIYYFVTMPPRIGKLGSDESLDGQGYPTFEAAKSAMIQKLYDEITVYQELVTNNQALISKIQKRRKIFNKI